MKLSHIQQLRSRACVMISTLGAVLDELAVVEETLRNRSKDRAMDGAVIAGRTANAAEAAEELARLAQEYDREFCRHLESLHREAREAKGGAS